MLVVVAYSFIYKQLSVGYPGSGHNGPRDIYFGSYTDVFTLSHLGATIW